jgi:hypothetical protein
LRAGNETGRLTIVAGNPDPSIVPPIVTLPVSVVTTPAPTVGRVFTAPAGQTTFAVTLLASPAAVDTPVTVISSNNGIAQVVGQVMVHAGSRTATVTVATGAAGSAQLTFRIGSDARAMTIVVGTPADGTEPPVVSQPVGVVVIPPPLAGRVLTPVAGQSTFTLQLLSKAATAPTTVTATSSDPNIVSVAGPIVIAAGSRTASVVVQTGVQGTATLTFRAAGETRALTVVVGPPAPGTEPPIVASPVGVAAIEQRRLGTIISAPGGRPALSVALLSSPAFALTPVSVSSSDPNVAIVNGPVSIAPGGRAVSLDIMTGAAGVATLTLHAGNDVAQIVVVVGTPSAIPVIVAPVVGVEVKQPQ